MDEALMLASIDEKETVAKKVIADALEIAKTPFVAFTGGKDSLVVLHLLRSVGGGRVPVMVLHIDTTVKFPEVYQYIDKMKKLWGFRLVRERNEEAIHTIQFAADRHLCCVALKTKTLELAIARHQIDCLFGGIRWDDQEAGKDGTFISQLATHTRVHPILPFSEQDIWNYIRKHNIPYCSLYDQGYRSLGCMPCTVRSIEDHERTVQDRDKEETTTKLRALGYF